MRSLTSHLPQRHRECTHREQVREVNPRTVGCEECLSVGMRWVHLRMCRTCGHVGCCNQSEGKHAFAHFVETGHPVIASHEPDETWSYCWVDEVEL